VIAPPSFAEAWAKTIAVINVLQKTRLYANANAAPAGNLLDLLRTYEATLKADTVDAGDIAAALTALRGGVNSILGNPALFLNPCVRMIAHAPEVNSSAPTIAGMLLDIYYYMAANNLRVLSRQFTRGPFVPGGLYRGNGRILRVTTDAYGFPLEASMADGYACKVVFDQNAGRTPGHETWQLSPRPFIDFVEWGAAGRGSGEVKNVDAVNGDDSLLLNASFSDRTGSDALPTAINSWNSSVAVVGDGSDYQVDRTGYYQAGANEGGNPASLRVYQSRTLTQALALSGRAIDAGAPYYSGVAWNAQLGGFTGQVTFGLGSKTKTVAVTNQAGWNLLELPGTGDQDLWSRNWQQPGTAVSIAVTKTSGAGTWINLDRVLLCPFVPYQGWFVLPVSGPVAWLKEDTGTINDTETGAVIQDWFHRAYGFSFPSAVGAAVTIQDPV
jgi:hypothetical protein